MEAIVLAGGLGTRLQSVLHEIPKCLAPVGHKPFLGYLLDWLVEQGATHVVFSVGHLREQVISYVEGREWPFSYDFAVEETPLGTGGGIRLALGQCRENQVFVINGDTFYPVNLKAMPFAGPVTVALKPMQNFSRYGTVSIAPQADAGLAPAENYFFGRCQKNQFPAGNTMPAHEQVAFAGPAASENYFSGRYPKSQFPEAIANPSHADAVPYIAAFHEKQPCAEGLINGGVYAIDRSGLDLSGLPEKFSFEKEVLEKGAEKGQIHGWVSDTYFIDIGIPEDYGKAQWSIPAWFAIQKASRAVLAADADTLFLDRDGVLNRLLEGDYVKTWEEWEWMPGVLEALALWARKYPRIVLVTNQRGVGRGRMTDAALAEVHARMLQEIQAAGGRLDLLLVCTATEDSDPRRKPNPGMFQEACALLPGIEPQRSVMVGDSDSDAQFAARCGMAFIRV
jgi:histidinol-phosphate phosphatase family protein